ncbi:UDP-N-acetylglucosamine--N-acetylmuramyl-(pentapeptide) pyrophosphoryl-undecaprenol N-acetylglucosamine transferase [Bacillus sp. THAF10]|uniref:undecaprenyldiphospho-muramoylpentapeptide beta-N-acetylglucosaminyltransferase n=1 Tax=Bacillus sp. THAF10 TaxID=2587848 RepID=UPI0012696958|nr:undecaprenyldiphospho-muramoylpentapeptide beta-N-acetylglucosaminyltransferase [Bacillus sp. THAF10]QFT89817.1 UDP-N-acetylglucosamine--N-acetylmuramyl-(pentapeptide) pyrophosphoryl-undecaprenol N-acetylglucosamine transferase [Bacillus sp. THAF10]
MTKKKIVFTGGGSAGHVTPNIAIMNKLKAAGWDITYIGSRKGIEEEIISNENVPFYGISSGKLRRYFDWKNFTDPLRILKGAMEALVILKKIKPRVVFSKGGFVTVPVVMAAKMLKIPVIIHESDITPGLANKIATKFATKVFVTFDETLKHFPNDKVLFTGSPIREELFKGRAQEGRAWLGFHEQKPILTIMGGSLGAKKINETVRNILGTLTEEYQIVHICGKGNVDPSHAHTKGYKQYEYINQELPDVLAASDYIISRAGANSIFEFLALRKPMLLIPLSKQASRGDQILNAQSFEKKGFAKVLFEEDMTTDTLDTQLKTLKLEKDTLQKRMSEDSAPNTLEIILQEIVKEAK